MAIALAALFCGSCQTPEPEPDPDPAPVSLSLSATSFSIGREGGQVNLTVTAPVRPQVSGQPSWVSVADGTFDHYSITYVLTVDGNTAYSSREAVLTVRSGLLSETVKIVQEAAEKPEEPVTPTVEITRKLATAHPTEKAQALYDFLYAQYGKKTLSSIMADVNWNHKLADKVYQVTGKYPAMNCYDFIHIYVPAGNNWIDYSNLTPVTEWAAAGGIVSLMWHFNVPKTKDTTPGKDGSGVTCTPSQTSFRAANIFSSGSWESQWFYQEMDKVVAIMLALQEKGIAAVWRPFHEAAGNATARQQASWTTAWFWWGYDGAETYKKLWKTMFDYFAAKGVRNLIWVWTTQNYNGNASSYDQDKAWYPGDACVDIVARDLYGSTVAANLQEFQEIQKAYPTKMVTLGECGTDANSKTAFASIPQVWNAGARWSWFMPWYGDCMPSDSWWKEALGNPNVLSRSDVKY